MQSHTLYLYLVEFLKGHLGFWNYEISLLPCHMTKKSVWEEYMQAAAGANLELMALSTFKEKWKALCPYITINKPATDLCFQCQKNNQRIFRSANTNDSEKLALLSTHKEHLDCAPRARGHYRACQAEAAAGNTTHLSFDFAQQAHIPSNPLQPGPIFFKTPRKICIFGICDEGQNQQTIYVIDEARVVKKGANAVISYLHHYLGIRYGSTSTGSKKLVLHADNCTGQNKNNYVMMYLMWRVLLGMSSEIEYNFMIAGHTKFRPDQHFGTFKKRFSRSYVSSLQDIKEVVDSSAINNKAILVGDGSEGSTVVNYYDWASFLPMYFHRIEGLLKLHQFTFKSNGFVELKEDCISANDRQFFMVKENPQQNKMPNIVIPTGLDTKRQWYLYEEIRPFCRPGTEDLICPQPSTPKEKVLVAEVAGATGKRKM